MKEYYIKRKDGVLSFRISEHGLEGKISDPVIHLGTVHIRFAKHTSPEVEQDLLKYQNGGALILQLRAYLNVNVRKPQ